MVIEDFCEKIIKINNKIFKVPVGKSADNCPGENYTKMPS